MKPTDLELAEINRITYCEPKEATPAFRELGFNLIAYSSSSLMQYYVLFRDEWNVIAIRGTNKRSDWFQNFMIERVAYSDIGKIHEGFALAASIFNTNYLFGKIIFTGHSKGAAIATILALDCGCEAVVFGSPMCGKFANNLFSPQIKRYTNNMDIVCRIPSGVLGYEHIGKEIYLNYEGKIVEPTWWNKLKDRFKSRLRAFQKKQKFDDFYDHNIEEYISKLKNL